MGEYARYNGNEIKIGTCEDMYYLRADQRDAIQGYSFDGSERFRFPFPDEDNIEPGGFEDHNRGVEIPGWTLPAEWADGHGSVQFTSGAGYVLSIPCPEAAGEPGFSTAVTIGDALLRVHRNGFRGHPVVRQQKAVDGELVTVVACGACDHAWRLSAEAAVEVAACFEAEAERMEWAGMPSERVYRHGETHRAFLREMASRILAGYRVAEAVA